MFYDSQIMNSKSLKNAWRAGNNQELSSEDVPLPKVCTRLDSWIASDYLDPCRRLSLRTSSILIDGAAKLYRQGLADIVQDMYKLEYKMITRKRPRDSTEDFNESNSSEFESNEAAPGHSASPVRPDRSDGQSGKSGENRISPRLRSKRSNKRKTASLKSIPNEGSSKASNESLPIGQVFIYEGSRSLIPSKIIVGTVNPEVKKHIKF